VQEFDNKMAAGMIAITCLAKARPINAIQVLIGPLVDRPDVSLEVGMSIGITNSFNISVCHSLIVNEKLCVVASNTWN
jgi:hypothetical protein